MKWTAERPTKPGIYWRRIGQIAHTEHLVEVYWHTTTPKVHSCLFVAHVNSNRDILIDDTTGIYEWSDEPVPKPQTAATPHGERR